MKKIVTNFFATVLCLSAMAQTNSVKGVLKDAQSQQALVGANIEWNKSKGISTDENGAFTLNCEGSLKIRISYIGYQSLDTTLDCSQANFTLSLQKSVQTIDQIEITASSNPNRSLLLQPESLVKIETSEIQRGQGLFLHDAINTNVPGVTMSNRTVSAGQQINIRGYGNGMGIRGVNNNFDMQGTKVYLNGIPLTDAEGSTLLDDIDFNSVGNVEILKGPSGTLYGLAIAGVVNLETLEAQEDKTSISQEVMGGSYGLLRTNTRFAYSKNKAQLFLNYGHQSYGGFMEHTASKKDFFNAVGTFTLSAKEKLSAYMGYTNSKDERNGELTIEQYDTLDYSGNARYIKNDAHSSVKTFRAGLSHSYVFNKYIANTTTIFGSGQSMDNSSAGGWTDKSPLNYGFRTTFDNSFDITEQIRLTGITGLEMQAMNAQTVGYGMGADSTNLAGYNIITSLRSDQITKSFTYSYFSEWTAHLPYGFSFKAGVGLSNMHIRLEDRLWGLNNNTPTNTKAKSYETSYKNLEAFNLAINKEFSKVASVYASYSEGYKTPVGSNIIISTTGQLNTGLKPEKGRQIELGTKGSFLNHRLFYTLAAFHAEFKDKFTTETVQNPSNTATLYSYIVNGGKLNNYGLEVLVKYEIMKNKDAFISSLRPFANLTYSNFRYKDFAYEKVAKDGSGADSTVVEDYSGNKVAGVAPLVFNAGVDVLTKIGLYGNINYNFRSKMPFTSDGLNEADAYHLLNAKIGFRKTIKAFAFDAYVGANNLTSTQYYSMLFINQLPDAYIPAPRKINFFGGASLSYSF
ncbi:MAG: TonB-dependent receptor plug domain-containing protein [Chitinophagales bacterium]|nr:TonB-dependent receptor plug domain-containing protein [Chitinophagales bacterium]